MAFRDHLLSAADRRALRIGSERHPEPLARLEYGEELAIKDEALAAFWREHRLPGRPAPVIEAPIPRGYRTTSKRRAVYGPGGLALRFAGAPSFRSALDRPEHVAVYDGLRQRLGAPPLRRLARALNWVIVRGDPGRLAVILNLRGLDADLVRGSRRLAEHLATTPLGIGAAYLFVDPTRSAYYLEARRPQTGLGWKRLLGPAHLEVRTSGVALRFPPTVFSQVNGPMLETMVREVASRLEPDGRPMLDLYCGYGLFAFACGGRATRVTGVDADGPAIVAARENAARLRRADRVRFLAGRIDGAFIARRLRPPESPEAILLDPPRTGTAEDLMAALAARRPARVVHIGCGIEEIPRAVALWQDSGYRLRETVPLDLFAGTAGLETILVLGPDARPDRRATQPGGVRAGEPRRPPS